ncbi:MAG: ABC transporter substrate-binding protein [Acidimicrobiales bacterium]|jgi:branched-chain amino acid transport system substrate-binding protein|nr:ABC transporter substrate-binding protein [Acidimicrobiales bacterium]
MVKRSRLTRLLALGMAVGLAATACGGGRDDEESSGGGASNGTTSGGEQATGFDIDTSECTDYQPDTGVTDTSIKIGVSLPLSGPYGTAFAAISRGYEYYINSVNEAGGVDGRQIEVIKYDDVYNAGTTKSNIDKLVQEDEVFATFNVIGTPNNLAFRDDYNAVDSLCVPNLFTGTGSQLWGQTEAYPFLIGSIPAYPTEAAVFVDYLQQQKPDATLAVLKQNDDFGEGYAEALVTAIEGTDIEIVQEEVYNSDSPDVTAQITALAGSGADAVFVGATGLACPNALKAITGAGWDPITYISATCTSQTILNLAAPEDTTDVLSTGYIADPKAGCEAQLEALDPELATNMEDFRAQVQANGGSAEDASNGFVAYGWSMGQLLEETLKSAPELTRESVMEAAYNLQDVDLPLLLPGVSANTNGVEDPFVIESLYIIKYSGTCWETQGEVVDVEGRTKEYIPEG